MGSGGFLVVTAFQDEVPRGWAMRRSIDRAAITIRRADVPAGVRRFTGRVLINGRMSGDLVGAEPRSFDVENGEHTVTVFFKRRPEILSSGRRPTASTSVSIDVGERVELVCGIRPDVVRHWNRARRAWNIRAWPSPRLVLSR